MNLGANQDNKLEGHPQEMRIATIMADWEQGFLTRMINLGKTDFSQTIIEQRIETIIKVRGGNGLIPTGLKRKRRRACLQLNCSEAEQERLISNRIQRVQEHKQEWTASVLLTSEMPMLQSRLWAGARMLARNLGIPRGLAQELGDFSPPLQAATHRTNPTTQNGWGQNQRMEAEIPGNTGTNCIGYAQCQYDSLHRALLLIDQRRCYLLVPRLCQVAQTQY